MKIPFSLEKLFTNTLMGAPIAALYLLVTEIRNWAYDVGLFSTYRSKFPVISIGNITAGGTGKTPLTIYVASQLSARGLNPVILSRGYGGSNSLPREVSATDSPSLVGDEPLLIRNAGFPVYVARSRVAGIKMIEQERSKVVVILDDGLQHRALSRDVEIVTIFVGTSSAITDFRRGHLLPYGRFRERKGGALNRATHLVLSYRQVLNDSIRYEDEKLFIQKIQEQISKKIVVARSQLESTGFKRLLDGEMVQCESAVAFAAIANPETFFSSVTACGVTLTHTEVFPDHHSFTENDLEKLSNLYPQQILLCTAKDGVKLQILNPKLLQQVVIFCVTTKLQPEPDFMDSVYVRATTRPTL